MTDPVKDPVRVSKHARLLKRIDMHKAKNKFSKEIVALCRAILREHKPDDEVEPDFILEGVRESLESPRAILNDEFFMGPLFPVAILRDTLKFYSADPLTHDFIDNLNLMSADKRDKNLMCYVWFCSLLGVNKDTTEVVLTKAKFFRSTSITSANPPSESDTADPFTPEQDSGIEPFQADVKTASTDHRDTMPKSQPIPYELPLHRRNHGSKDQYASDAASKRAVTVQQYFKDDRYGGEITESISDKIQDFEVCAMQMRLNPDEKATFFINAFKGPARRFFLNHAKPGMSYENLEKIMRDEYDSPARQIQVQSELETLTFDRFMKSNSISDESHGLKKLVDHINVLSPQCPAEFRSEPQKMRFLRNAVLDVTWAHQPLSQCTAARYSFNEFATALREALQLHLEKAQRSLRNPAKYLIQDDSQLTLYGQYGKHPRTLSRNRDQIHRSRPFKNKVGRDGKRLACYKCGSNEHLVRSNKCKPGAVLAHARKQISSGVPAIHLLNSFISGMEGEATDTNDPSYNSDLEEMDSFFTTENSAEEDIHDDEDAEESDKVLFTNLLSAHFGHPSVPSKHEFPEDFRQGGCSR